MTTEYIATGPASRAVLAALERGPARTVELAERTHYEVSTVEQALFALRRRGLVKRGGTRGGVRLWRRVDGVGANE